MKPKHLKLIAVFLGVVVLLSVPRFIRDDEGVGSVEIEDGFSFSVAEPVTRVDIVELEPGRTIRLERGETGWTVDGYRADMPKIETLLEALPELSSSILVARNPDNHASLGVADTVGRRIEVYTEAGGPHTFHLGNRDVVAGGYFVREPGAEAVFRLEGPAGGYLGRDRDGWRDRVIASVDVDAVRDIMIRRAEGDETVLRREGDVWTIDGTAADSASVAGLLGMLPVLSATGFPTDREAAMADFSTPDAELDVFAEDSGDVTNRQLVLGLRFLRDAEAGDWLVEAVDGDEVYRLAPFSVQRLLPERPALLPEE